MMDTICFLIPSTTNNRNWNDLKETYLYESLLVLNRNYKNLTVFVSFDTTDILYKSQLDWIEELLPNLKFHLIRQDDIPPGNVVAHWNRLYQIAYKHNFTYFYFIGDDIQYPDNNWWLPKLIGGLQKTNGIGFSAGDSGNPHLPMTQFLVSRKHYQIFKTGFNKMLTNWWSDNYLNELYPKKYIHYFPDIKLLNAGGTPRYIPKDDSRLYKILVKRDKKILNHYLQ
jgi:hypothetical protein